MIPWLEQCSLFTDEYFQRAVPRPLDVPQDPQDLLENEVSTANRDNPDRTETPVELDKRPRA